MYFSKCTENSRKKVFITYIFINAMNEEDTKAIEQLFHEWIKLARPELAKFNPRMVCIENDKVIFGMNKHYGRNSISVETIKTELENSKKLKK